VEWASRDKSAQNNGTSLREEFAGLVADVRTMVRPAGAGGLGEEGTAATGAAASKLAPAARMVKTQVELFLGGQYIDVMCFCKANMARLRRSNCMKVKTTSFAGMTFEQPLDLEHQLDPAAGQTVTALRLEGWEFLLRHLGKLTEEEFGAAHVQNMRDWWEEVQSSGAPLERQVRLMDEFFLMWPKRVRTPGWKATLKDEIFRVQNILTGLAEPAVHPQLHGATPAAAPAQSAGPQAARVQQAQQVQKRKQAPRKPLADPSVILACSTRRELKGECKHGPACRLSHTCLVCGKNHSASACQKLGTWDEVKAAGAYVAQI
jgi:hypothetical protein